MPNFGERVRELRIRRGFTQGQLAGRAGVTPQVISNIERSYTSERPRSELVAALAKALNTSTDYLIGTSSYAIVTTSEEEQDLIMDFRRLSGRQKSLVSGITRELARAGREA